MNIQKYNSRYEEPKSLMFQMLDVNGNILHVNEKWLEEMGYSREEVVGKFFGSYIVEEDLNVVSKNFPHLKDYGFVNNVQFKLRKKDGVIIETVLNGISVYDENGNFVNTRCELRNINYFMQAELRVKALLEKERFFKNNLYLKSELNHAVVYCKDLDQFLHQIIDIFKEPVEIANIYISFRDTYGNRRSYIDYQNDSEFMNKMRKFLNNDNYMSQEIKESFTLDNNSENQVFDNIKSEFYSGESLIVLSIKSKKKFVCDKIDFFLHLSNMSDFKEEWMFFADDLKNILYTAIDKFETQEKLHSAMNDLYKMSTTDSLTGAENKYKFEKIMTDEIEKFNRDKKPITLVMYDVDNFKSINDNLGHCIGDEALKVLSKLVKNNIKGKDQLFRFGGDEFILLFRDVNAGDVLPTIENIKSKIENYDFCNFKMSCSFGITEIQEGDNLDLLLRRVDYALYKSKGKGKNTISIHRSKLKENFIDCNMVMKNIIKK